MTTLVINLDRSSPVPAYHQIAASIQHAIDSGRLAPGERLESEVAMSERLGVSRATTRQALRELVARGQLVRRRAIGTYVTAAAIRRPADLRDLFCDVGPLDPATTTAQSICRVEPPADVAHVLDVAPGEDVVLVHRVRRVDGRVTADLMSYLPAVLAPEPCDLERFGLDRCLRGVGVVPRSANQRIRARVASTAEALDLGRVPGAPLLEIERTTFDDRGHVVEFAREVFPGSDHVLRTTVSVG